MREDSIRVAIATAERAVAPIADLELRRIAFERVLDHLLRIADTPLAGEGPTPKSPGPKSALRGGSNNRAAPSTGPSAWIERLQSDGFFAEPRTITDTVAQVRALGHAVESKDITFPLVRMVRLRRLRREQKPEPHLRRKVWVYTNY